MASLRFNAFTSSASRACTARRTSVRVSAAMKLYSNPASRGKIIEWYIQEKGIPDIEVLNLDMKEKREHKQPEFLKVNPFGRLPALTDGDMAMFESGAILLYLAEKCGETKTPQQRAIAAQWALFANSTLANGLFLEQFREKALPELMGTLDGILAKQPYVAGQEFTVSDVLVGAYLLYLPAFMPNVDLSTYKNVVAYMDRLVDRPACAATVGARAAAKKQETAATGGVKL